MESLSRASKQYSVEILLIRCMAGVARADYCLFQYHMYVNIFTIKMSECTGNKYDVAAL